MQSHSETLMVFLVKTRNHNILLKTVIVIIAFTSGILLSEPNNY